MRTLMYGILYISIHFFRLIGWWRWRVEGWENLPPRESGGMVMAMNHVNGLDIPAIGAMLPFSYRLSWLGKAEIFEQPIPAWFYRTMHVIPINRGRRDMAALNTAIDALRAGDTLLVFPEGHRSQNGVLQEGRSGAVRMAIQAGVPIVPIAIMGTEHGLKGTCLRRPVLVRIGKPLFIPPSETGKYPADVMERHTTAMMRQIAALLPPEQRGPYR
ncbi:lysophospholipid acyltransferase family protein [Candidatus Oscillochloris fontis]|uniref:lysophospholipid acyltransferase family protein n=1 Tax=Candidatus Oscillochloris fontis TaxID=2496868 RepID=UPI00101D2CBF|nr:lysophospholipid acyltransferase family protein [Candidatus Oscillochloris fontis]